MSNGGLLQVRGLERLAGVLSVIAGGIHAGAGPEHFSEWWAYALFFFGAAFAQVSYGLILLTQGIEAWGGWSVVRHRVYLAGIVGNLAIVALWIVTRTVGVPVGPEAFEPEEVGIVDLSSKAVELLLLAVLVALLRKETPARP